MITVKEHKLFQFFIGDKAKSLIEKYILIFSIVSFFIHLTLIYLSRFELIQLNDPYHLLSNPIAAIYTPFSFILIYEIYLLIYYLPRSITTYISKQYEIITLIVIRRIFKDISNISLQDDLFTSTYNAQIFIDLGAAVPLFFLIYLFRRNAIKSVATNDQERLSTFIRIKKWISALLIPALTILALYHFLLGYTPLPTILQTFLCSMPSFLTSFSKSSYWLMYYCSFFLFFNSDSFHIIIRNSGFIISTILIRISFMTEGLSNIILIVSSLLFGLLIQMIYNACEKRNLFHND